MKPLWVLTAFVLGFIVNRVGLPPLVGYLIAGFALNALGAEGGGAIENIADLGVILLLFSIGLKLRLRSLAKPEVWAGASLHMLITVLLFGVLFVVLGATGLQAFSGMGAQTALLIAFSLSFSSTVFAVKVLEERSEMASLHGRVSIGILIMQDIFAVIFLTVSTGKVPSPWALLVPVALAALRPVMTRVLSHVGHRELLLLFGVFMALGLGAGGFELVGLKPDLGALVMGILLAGHPKADELAKVLLSFKDLFLVGFFLNIGLSGTPDLSAFGIAAALTVLGVRQGGPVFWSAHPFSAEIPHLALGRLQPGQLQRIRVAGKRHRREERLAGSRMADHHRHRTVAEFYYRLAAERQAAHHLCAVCRAAETISDRKAPSRRSAGGTG